MGGIDGPARRQRDGLFPGEPARSRRALDVDGLAGCRRRGGPAANRQGGDGGHHCHGGGHGHRRGGQRPTEEAAEAHLANGPFHQVEAGGRRPDDDGHPDQIEDPPGQSGPGLVEVDDHGPVPQVDAVGDHPHPPQRRQLQDPAQSSRLQLAYVGDHDGGQRGAHGEPAPEHPTRRQAARRPRPGPESGQDEAGHNGGEVQGATGRRAGLTATSGHDGHDGPGQHVEDPGLGAEVHGAGIRAGMEQERHGHDRSQGAGHGHDGQDGAPVGADPGEQEQQHRRPHQVELLLDPERPGVLQGGGRAELGEVRLVGEDELPVGHVEEGGQGVAPQGRQVDGGAGGGSAQPAVEHHEEADGDEQDDQRGQEAPGPASPEGPQPDPVGSQPFLQEQRRDEEARQDEEDVHAEEAARGPSEAEVVRDHTPHGQRPQTVERREVAAGDGGGDLRRVRGRGRDSARHGRSRPRTVAGARSGPM